MRNVVFGLLRQSTRQIVDRWGRGNASSSSESASSSSGIAGMGTGGMATGGMGTGGMGTGGMATGGMGTGGGNVEPPPPCSISVPQKLTIYSNNNIEPISLVWNGSEYVALYRDIINAKMGIYLSRWSKSGIQQGSAQLLVESPMPAQDGDFFSTTVWNGNGFGVLWSHQKGTWALFFSSYDAMGNTLSAPVQVAFNNADGHALTWNGNGYGLVWLAGGKAYFGKVSSSGAIIGTPTLLGNAQLGGSSPEVSIAWSGNEYGVAWQYNGQAYFARVNADGAKVIPEFAVGPSIPDDGGPHLVSEH